MQSESLNRSTKLQRRMPERVRWVQRSATHRILGGWELRDGSGRKIDRAQQHAERACYFVHRIVDSPVHRYEINAPTSFTPHFENGYSKTVFDDSDRYESFSIQPDGINI